AGTALIHGRPYASLPDPVRTVGALLETSGFHPGRSAVSHLRAQCRAARVPLSRIDEVLGIVGLVDAARRRIGGFSMGMRQLTGRTADVVRVRSPDAAELRRLLKAEGLQPRLGRAGELLVTGTTTEAVGKLAARNRLVVLELTVEGGNLEAVFLALTSGRGVG